MSEEFRHRLRVRYAECDPQGVVYFARYPALLDVALTELWRERIGPYNAMVEAGSDMVVAELNVRYFAPALFDDELEIAITVARVGETSLVLDWRILRDDRTLVTGTIRQVCIDPATKAKKPLPPDVRAALA
jgi:acyl-CoA thioester hydrolase